MPQVSPFKVGDRVRLVKDFTGFQMPTMRAGLLGTVAAIGAGHDVSHDPLLSIRLDETFEALSEWDNCLHVDDDCEIGPEFWEMVPAGPSELSALLAREFPDFDQTTIPAGIPSFMVCMAWRNDPCPIWQCDEPTLSLWVDYADTEDREHTDSMRFSVHLDGKNSVVLYEGDDSRLALFALWAGFFGQGFHPDNRGADCAGLSDLDAAAYDKAMREAFEACDPYAVAFDLMGRMGLLQPVRAAR